MLQTRDLCTESGARDMQTGMTHLHETKLPMDVSGAG